MALISCAQRDADSLCQQAKDILAEPRIAPAQRLPRLLVEASIVSPQLRGLVERLPNTPASQRYTLLRGYMRQEGRSDWHCSALEVLLGSGDVDPERAN